MPLETKIKSRKDRRKEERLSKRKKKRYLEPDIDDAPALDPIETKTNDGHAKKKQKSTDTSESDPYTTLDPTLAAALRQDDAEIAEMEEKLGLANEKERKKLHREFAKMECYGDDFGDFLLDLDDLPTRLSKKATKGKESTATSKDESRATSKDDPYSHLDPALAEAMRRDDAEIAELESKLGTQSEKGRKKMHREYAKLECYGDDFGDFLDELDELPQRLSGNKQPRKTYDSKDSEDEDNSEYSSSDGEDILPMKNPAEDTDDDSDIEARIEKENDPDSENSEETASVSSDEVDNSENSDSEDEISGDNMDEDHAVEDTYRPLEGEDIYGNKTDGSKENQPTKKYVPPHLRKKVQEEDDENRLESLRTIQRSLNNVLNRLSEDTLTSVAQSIAKLYKSHPTADLNDCIWKNVVSACVDRPMLMSGLIPVYIACMSGVHFQTGDQVQLGGFILEKAVTQLWSELGVSREKAKEDSDMQDEVITKSPSNLILVLCCLYNFSLVHCTFIYDVIRHLIDFFSELDIEILLLILSHCGHALRSDDPSALKEIVLLVQERALKAQKTDENSTASSSRVQYFLSAISDLKNNKKRKQDTAVGEKTAKLRKLLGGIKSTIASTGVVRVSDSNLRITLNDILNVETKGRWWKVGASWLGNQYLDRGDGNSESEESDNEGDGASRKKSPPSDPNSDEALLQLASKCRMNTDIRRSIFCIIMGSADCDDAFEKLVRGGMLKNRTERDTVRVLIECCGNEKTHNPFYSHLASRICDYQPQCKFTFQLAYWDLFKQFDDVKMRKAANLAKLFYHLIAVDKSLKMNVLKVMDMSEDMSETAGIFLTVFFSSIFEKLENPMEVKNLFDTGIPRGPGSVPMGSNKVIDSEEQNDDTEGLRENLSLFFMQTLKASPKNKKGSKFRANYKAAVKACETDGLDM